MRTVLKRTFHNVWFQSEEKGCQYHWFSIKKRFQWLHKMMITLTFLNFLIVAVKAARRRIQPWKSQSPVCRYCYILSVTNATLILNWTAVQMCKVFWDMPLPTKTQNLVVDCFKSKLFSTQAPGSLASRRSSSRWRSSTEQAFQTRRRGRTSSWFTRTSSWPCSPWSGPWTYSRSSMRTPLVRYVTILNGQKCIHLIKFK